MLVPVSAVITPVNVTVLFAANEVNDPVPRVLAPIFILLMLPVVDGDIVKLPDPVGLIVTLPVPLGFNDTV